MSHIRSGSGYPVRERLCLLTCDSRGQPRVRFGHDRAAARPEERRVCSDKGHAGYHRLSEAFLPGLSLEPYQGCVGEPLPPRTGQALSLSEEGSNLPCQDTLAF